MNNLRQITQSLLAAFRRTDTVGKIVVLVGALLLLGLVCAVPVALLSGDEPAQPAATALASRQGIDPEPTADRDKSAAIMSTAADETRQTPTSLPTATPARRATPTATQTEIPPTATSTATAVPTATSTPAGETAVVTRIIDGDTIVVDLHGRSATIRYIGVDTPESGDPCFQEAAQANAALVAGQTVRLVKDQSETDRYDRLLRYVYVGDTFINAELVAQGWAVARRYPPDTAQAAYLESLQAGAPTHTCETAVAAATQPPPPSAPTSAPPSAPTSAPPSAPTSAPTAAPPTSAPTAAPPAATEPPPPPPAAASTDVQITGINYDGAVPRVESDEYVVITNTGAGVINLGGWRLNAGDPGQDFGFPGFDLQPGQSCRVYTNEHHPETCGFSFGSGRAIWNNDGDCGYLYDNTGAQVSQRCY